MYGGQTDSPLNDLIDEFNQTVGKEQGIIIQPTMVSNTNEIHEAVLAAANHDPGAPELPDLFSSYPKTVLAMPDEDVLVDYRDYFTEEELAKFVPEFLNEGIIQDRLIVLPVAKSTEIMFIDKTLFDRFSQATGASYDQLETWEGLYLMSEDYRKWTSDVTDDNYTTGKTFFAHDYHFNYFQVGVESLGQDFFENDKLAFNTQMKQVWDPYAKAAIEGGIWLQGGYATEPLRTGDAVVSVASSASVLYYEDIVTYPNNESESIELIAAPVPIFKNGEKMVMQRGAGICMTKSTQEREKAAALFMKWLTEPNKNIEFVTSVGYMPVTTEAFDYLPDAVTQLTNPKYKSLYEAFIDTQSSFKFYYAPQLSTYLDLEMKFEDEARKQLQAAREEYLEIVSDESDTTDREELVEKLSDKYYEQLKQLFE